MGSRREGERALTTAGTELTDLRLEINSGKSHVVSYDEGVRFLGTTVTASTLNAAEAMSHPLETTVYVDRQGSLIRVRGERLVVVDGEDSLLASTFAESGKSSVMAGSASQRPSSSERPSGASTSCC